MNDWCILRTSPGSTLTLARSLAGAGYEVWTPVDLQLRRAPRSKARREVEVAITPGFVFARWSDRERLAVQSRSPSQTYHVWDSDERRMVSRGHPHFSMFRYNGDYPRVTDLGGLQAIEAKLHQLAERRRKQARESGPVPRFSAGDVVRMTDDATGVFGAFVGLDLTVVEENAGRMVRLSHPDWLFPLEICAWTLAEVKVKRGTPEQGDGDRIALAS